MAVFAGVPSGAPPGVLKASVDLALQAWADTYTDGNDTTATVQQCRTVAGGVMVGTMYRRFANGTCFSYSDLACTTLQDGYLQVSLTSLCTHAGVATTFQSCFLSLQPCGENSYLGLHGGLCVWAVG